MPTKRILTRISSVTFLLLVNTGSVLLLSSPTSALLPNSNNDNKGKDPLSGLINVYRWYNNNNANQNANQINPLLFPVYPSALDLRDFDLDQGLLPPQPLPPTIPLTTEEAELFRSLRYVRDTYSPTTTIRVAGGWVRDKLLCRSATQDIDFVLSDQSGADFARLFHSYLVNTSTAENIQWKDYNQTQSHHLQTATLKMGDELEIDFCQLRQDVYKGDSRVPLETNTASIVEDAFRRDLTINALYYNLQTNQVEDWTEMGVRDLQLRKIATPRKPRTTLLEDPLRILRAIRFAAQLSFRLDPTLKQITAKDEKVQLALEQKVSRERMGNEMDAIFQTNDPSRGIRLLMETNLMNIMFPLERDQSLADQMYMAGFLSLIKTQTLVSRVFTQIKDWEPSRRRWLWYAAFCKPICGLQGLESEAVENDNDMENSDKSLNNKNKSKKGRRDESIVYQLLTQGLKRPTGDTEAVEMLIRGANHLEEFLTERIKIPANVPTEQQIADLRWQTYNLLKPMGNLWKESLLLALASFARQEVTEVVRQYKLWVHLVENVLSVQDALDSSWKPLLNGNEIQKEVLPSIHGKGFRQVMEAQEEWQVRHCVFPVSSGNDDDQDAFQDSIDALTKHLAATFPEYH